MAQERIWQGRKGTQRYVVMISPDSLTKEPTLYFCMPDESDKIIKAANQSIGRDSISGSSDVLNLSFKGRFSKKGRTISGEYNRYEKVCVTLEEVENIQPLIMPQDPKPPFPYRSEEFSYTDPESGITFGATLTIPDKGLPCPAVILVSGTGRQDRDATMAGGHKMFLVLSDYLSRNGIAVLRVDDRGVGKTSGVYETSTTDDFAKDVLTSINFLKSRNEIDKKKIGLIGHSEGGAVISIAASRTKDVSFMISLAGLATNGLDALRKQNADLVNAAKIPDYDKKRSNEINEIMFRKVYDNVDSDTLDKILFAAYDEWKKGDDAFFKSLNKEFDHFRFPIHRYVLQAQTAWYRFFIKYDPANYLTKVNIPILALNGDRDLMVSCKENLQNWAKYPALGGNNNVKTITLPGLNHLFQHCVSGEQREIPMLDETFSPEVLKIISDWIYSSVI
jgi:pimeloyl-ACP methyl ester carboxylesterase